MVEAETPAIAAKKLWPDSWLEIDLISDESKIENKEKIGKEGRVQISPSMRAN